LSGKGRCNLTNAGDLDSFLERFPQNGQFLRDAFKNFFNKDLMDFFEKRGLKLKVERQLRVFPVTDTSASVLDVLVRELEKNKVEVMLNASLKEIELEGLKVKAVILSKDEKIECRKVIIATGGVSYSFTGSTGDGMKIAGKLQHKITPIRPGLIGLVTGQGFVKDLEGLSLKNIRLKFCCGAKKMVTDIGEMLFTGVGISGPLVISSSGKIVDWLSEGTKVYAEIDLKPALSEEQLDGRVMREFLANPGKAVKNVFKDFLPQRLIAVFIGIAGIEPEKKAAQITKEERKRLVRLFKSLRLDITSPEGMENAMVTRGGVSLKDIDPRTMGSRKIKGLYFAGEVMDVDADTGGYNLQAAFSTGYLAGESAASA
jgi:predicted Rossmann fold flavoprotein